MDPLRQQNLGIQGLTSEPAVWPQPTRIASLGLGVHICKMGLAQHLTQGCAGTNGAIMWTALSTALAHTTCRIRAPDMPAVTSQDTTRPDPKTDLDKPT